MKTLPESWHSLQRIDEAEEIWRVTHHGRDRIALQYWLFDHALSWPLALLLSCGLTLAICMLSCELLVRRTRLRRWVG